MIIEDDLVTRAKLAAYFIAEGYRVSEASDGATMRMITASRPADLFMIDINLPGDDGFQLTRELRAASEAGIILVTGRTDTVDRIVGLEIGADDYVTKPFNQRELLARVKNLLRRVRIARGGDDLRQVRRFLGWTFDMGHRSLQDAEGRFVELTRAEFKALALLSGNPGEVMTRDRLLHEVANRDWHPGDRTVDVVIRRLRRKLADETENPRIIVTSHGEGYLFAVTPD
jgi:two-component system torCAD operon response regulator TorR